jgi:hypothetical protein
MKKERIMKFLKTIMIASLLLLMFGCVSYRALYDISLSEVERPTNAKERYGDQKIISFEEEGKTKFSFEDKMVKVIWIPISTQFLFRLTNKTDHSIKIIWDEAVYVDENGMSKRIMHSGVKYTDRNNPQPPTTIVRGATISDLIFPTDNVYWVSGQYGGWRETPLFPNSSITSAQEITDKAKQYVGKSVQVLLPLKIEDVVNEYIFSFKINDVQIKQ